MGFWLRAYKEAGFTSKLLRRAALIVFGMLAIPTSLIALAAPEVPPALLSQIQSMSSEQRAQLASQYGINLPSDSAAETVESSVGEPADPLIAPEVIQQELPQESSSTFLPLASPDDAGPQKFGYDFFSGEVSTFAPVDSAPAPSSYELGPGDVLNVYLYGNESADLSLTINRDGILILPRLGPISVVGLTFEEAKKLIDAKVSSQLVGTKVVVSINKLRAINVFLAGEVAMPGNYSVSGLSTAMQVLFAAGGITELGTLRNIEIKRRGESLRTLDLYDILLKGDTTGDVRLSSGDTVFVPVSDSEVEVIGAVKRPAIYEVREGETIRDVIEMAGGLSSKGYSREIAVERRGKGADSMSQLQIDLNASRSKDVLLSDGDKVEVREIKSEVLNRVTVRGALVRPGGYAWVDGMRISDIVSNVDEDLRAEADLTASLLVRRTGKGLEIITETIDLGAAIVAPGSEADVLLNPKDELLIFALPYVNESYQSQLTEEEEPTGLLDVLNSMDSTLISATGPLDLEEEKEDGNLDSSYEDRRVLIDEVVAKLEAQAQSPQDTLVVEISGDVRLPGKYPLPNDKALSSLFGLAGGFETSAYLREVEVNRTSLDENGRAITQIYTVDLDEGGLDMRFELQPLDQIRVNRIPFWSYGNTVEVTGAVEFPGKFPVALGEMLSSLLVRAGGLDDFAFPDGAVLVKASAKKREREQIERLVTRLQKNSISERQTREKESFDAGGVSAEDFNLIEKLLDSGVTGRVVIDLPAIMEGDLESDIRLEDGDSLHIPYITDTVMVVGEVKEPGTFRFSESRSIDDYISLAAGSTVRANRKEIYIVRANGSVRRYANDRSFLKFTSSDKAGMQVGDTIVVPLNEEYQPVLSRYKEVSTVIFQSIASLYPLFRL